MGSVGNTNSLSPFVYWAQTSDKVTLRIDLRDTKEPDLDIQNDRISFKGTGIGAKGFTEYAFEFRLFDEIKPKTSRYNITGRQVDIVLDKELSGSWWPRLTEEEQKLAWLKIDFDRWKTEDGDADSSSDDDTGLSDKSWQDRAQREQMRQLRKELELSRNDGDVSPLKSAFPGVAWKQTYLIIYGLFQLLAYMRICMVILVKLMMHKQDAFTHMFDSIGSQIIVCQCAAVLEVIHSLVGLVNTSAKTATLQVLGRNLALFLLIIPEPRLQEKPVVTLLILVWALSEVFRYPYYILNIIHKEYYIVKWLRYSMWILLYPLGFMCEGVIMLRSLPYLEETGRFDIRLPEPIDYTIQFQYILIIYMILFLPGGVVLMNYMYKQRRAKIGVMAGRRDKLKRK